MKVGLYGKSGQFRAGIHEALAQGITALGWRPIWRNPAPFTPDQVEKFDLVLHYGMQGRGPDLVKAYGRAGIPVVIVDFGYLKRGSPHEPKPEGYFQVGLNGLNWLPPRACPEDRWEKLGLSLPRARAKADKEGHILICGQKAGDSQHSMDLPGLKAWATATMGALRRHTDRPIVWRPCS